MPSGKPLRLRAACTECHAAKVRCSGEKDGCSRCRKNGLLCEYMVSMVGRAPKRRRLGAGQSQQGRSNHHIDAQPRQGGCTASKAFNIPVPSVVDLACGVNDDSILSLGNFPGEIDDNLQFDNIFDNYADTSLVSLDARNVYQLEASNILPESNVSRSDSTGTPSDTANQASVGNSNQTSSMPDDNLPLFTAQDRTASSVRSLLSEKVDARVPNYYRDKSVTGPYSHATALMDLINSLESYVRNSDLPVDQAMRMNRKAMTRIRSIMEMPEFKACHSCPPLVATIMDLVVGLYELVLLPFQQQQQPSGDQQQTSGEHEDNANHASQHSSIQSSTELTMDISTNSSSSSCSSSRPGGRSAPIFQFGCLEFEPEEQTMLLNQILRRDLRRCVETIQHCNLEMQQRRKPGTIAGVGHSHDINERSHKTFGDRVQAQWYNEMEQQARKLLKSIHSESEYP